VRTVSVDVGSGERVLVLIAHHDAVPGSPGANDNAPPWDSLEPAGAALGVAAGARARAVPLHRRGGARLPRARRHYVAEANLEELAGVLSLELVRHRDSVAIWDAAEETPFLGGGAEGARVHRARARREPITSWVASRCFGSDHRAFAPEGVPAYGFTLVPSRNAEALRQFVFSPMRSAFRYLIRRPTPFDTYHTARDAGVTLQPAAMALALRALEAVIAEVTVAGLGASGTAGAGSARPGSPERARPLRPARRRLNG